MHTIIIHAFRHDLDRPRCRQTASKQRRIHIDKGGVRTAVDAGGRNIILSGDQKAEKAETNSSEGKTPQQRAKKALQKFIGSFKEGIEDPPPTRSWRNLQTLDSFDEQFQRFYSAKKEADLGVVRSEMKVFKTALNDLISLARSANTGLTKALENVQKKRDKTLTAAKGDKQKEDQKKTSTLMDFVMDKGTQFSSKNLAEIVAPMGDHCNSTLVFSFCAYLNLILTMFVAVLCDHAFVAVLCLSMFCSTL